MITYKDNIVFTGYMPSNKVKLYYKLADTLIFPSLNEQSSYVVLEAMSFKVPMVVTDIAVFKMLKNGHSCLKIRLNDKKDLDNNSFKHALKTMVQDGELRCKIAKNAYGLYAQKYSSEVMFDNTYLT